MQASETVAEAALAVSRRAPIELPDPLLAFSPRTPQDTPRNRSRSRACIESAYRQDNRQRGPFPAAEQLASDSVVRYDDGATARVHSPAAEFNSQTDRGTT